MCPAIKRPIRSAAPDIGLEVSAHGFRGQECVNSALSYLAVVVVGALEQDDHVLLGRVITNPLHEAATVNGGTLESVKGDGAAIFDCHSLGGCSARESRAKPCH
jgi:hypothetical protein